MSDPIWRPSKKRIQNSNMHKFMEYVNLHWGKDLETYEELYNWSVVNIPDFWKAMWDFGEVIASSPFTTIADDIAKMPGAKWFEGCRLNFAENLLRFRDDRIALSFRGEGQHETASITYAVLYERVARLVASLSDMGIKPGDRIAGFMPNMIEAVIAMLAATSLGAIWSSCSPDFGIQSVMDRFGQIQPRVLFTANGYHYAGKKIDSLERIADVVKQIPSIERVVVVPYTETHPDPTRVPNGILFHEFLSNKKNLEIDFVQIPPDHPLYIMYSSGTTGVPKCIVHSVAGTLVQHLKELKLHADLTRDDTIFYYTTCGWMMWNWLVSSLSVGARVFLFDGSPFHPGPEVLWQIAEKEKITVFGTSAKYLAAIEKAGLKPKEQFDLTALKAIFSTGSPLSVESFEYVYRDVKQDVCLSSISGGTDIISCFALGNPMGPVFPGELQCRGLGMKVEAFDDSGRSVIGQKGELVCTAAAPSMPVSFWNDPEGEKNKSAYFELHEGIWSHGDYIEIRENGGVVIYGRSDATLNPGGVRIGTAEIYRQVESISEVIDSLVVGQEWEDDDVRVILFVKLRAGITLDETLVKKIKTMIRRNTTPRHVPAKIIEVADIPYTISGKKVELAVRNIIHSRKVKNKDALANPEALAFYKDLTELTA